jgi:hypothetical protein
MPCITDFLLVQFSAAEGSMAGLLEAGRKGCEQNPLPMRLHRMAWSRENHIGYLYARLIKRSLLETKALGSSTAEFERALAGACVLGVSRLENVFERPGFSRAQTPAFHYVVEMDPETGWMPEIARWYDTEHMPGLAGVPGCVHAMRMLNHDQGPLSLACYDLLTEQTLGSPPWLAVRATAWSDLTRPHFTHTKRSMFEVIA